MQNFLRLGGQINFFFFFLTFTLWFVKYLVLAGPQVGLKGWGRRG